MLAYDHTENHWTDEGRHYNHDELLLHYCAAGPCDAIRTRLLKGGNVHCADRMGRSPLHQAALFQPSAVEVLLLYGADLEARDHYGNSPLLYACQHCALQAPRTLLEQGANIHATNRKGFNALMVAVSATHYPALLRLLLEHGANPQHRAPDGESVWSIAEPKDAITIRSWMAKREKSHLLQSIPAAAHAVSRVRARL